MRRPSLADNSRQPLRYMTATSQAWLEGPGIILEDQVEEELEERQIMSRRQRRRLLLRLMAVSRRALRSIAGAGAKDDSGNAVEVPERHGVA
jgi:hypothetical protein